MRSFLSGKCCYTLFSIFAIALLLSASTAQGEELTADAVLKLPECSLAKTNESCKLIVDRANPLSPPTVQMYSDKTLTVVIKNPKNFERYFLDVQSGQATLNPDFASSIVQGMLPAMGKMTYALVLPGKAAEEDPCTVAAITTKPAPGKVAGVLPAFQDCLAQLAHQAIGIYRQLEPYTSPDSLTPNAATAGADLSEPQRAKLQNAISGFLKSEANVSNRISVISADKKLDQDKDGPVIAQLTAMQKAADAVASDLLGYSQRIADLANLQSEALDCKKITSQGKNLRCVYITSRKDDSRVYQSMVTRTITYSLNTYNLISNSQQAVPDQSKKKLLATVVLNFADQPTKFPGRPPSGFRWEPSAGAFFSTLPVRSFSAAPVFTGGTVTDKIVSRNLLRPTIVPFAAANYRLSNDLKWTRWKSAIYWTGAIGINPNTVSADFATGLSMSWRMLMLSALCHFGHDVRLTQGLQVGQSLGASFSGNPSTQTYWTTAFALGVSVRIPTLTGR